MTIRRKCCREGEPGPKNGGRRVLHQRVDPGHGNDCVMVCGLGLDQMYALDADVESFPYGNGFVTTLKKRMDPGGAGAMGPYFNCPGCWS